MKSPEPVVFVVDDDSSMREALSSLIRSVGLRVEPYSSAQAFLCSPRPDTPACLVLDVRLPEFSGLELQRALATAGDGIPIIFITGHGDIPMSVRAMKGGAVEFLTKPFADSDLLDAVRQSLERDRAAREQRAQVYRIKRRYDSLTSRERQVLREVLTGKLNKQIAATLGVSEITVKVHRRRVMEKMGARSVAELVRTAERITYTQVS
jgi:FixJ family two-component response regulator